MLELFEKEEEKLNKHFMEITTNYATHFDG
jgi:hypothetical protein